MLVLLPTYWRTKRKSQFYAPNGCEFFHDVRSKPISLILGNHTRQNPAGFLLHGMAVPGSLLAQLSFGFFIQVSNVYRYPP